MTKLCKDCKWCDHVDPPWYAFLTLKIYPRIQYAKCKHPSMFQTNPIDGTIVYKRDALEYCSIARSDWYRWEDINKEWIKRGKCGPEGRNWEPKDGKD